MVVVRSSELVVLLHTVVGSVGSVVGGGVGCVVAVFRKQR